MWGNNKTMTEKKRGYTRTSRPKQGENKLYKLTDTARQTYVELENNIIPQDRETTQNHRQNNQRFEEIQLLFFRDKE